jgi:hypothetical protein
MQPEAKLYSWTDAHSVDHTVTLVPHADSLSLPDFEFFVPVVDVEEKNTGKRFYCIPFTSLRPLPHRP